MKKAIDISGQKFGKWLVLEKSNKQTSNHVTYWYCKCECGNICEVAGTDLRAGKTTQCRICAGTAPNKKVTNTTTYKAAKHQEKEIGQRYGKLVITDFAYQTLGGSMWKCKCDCGNEIITRINNLHSGRTQSCGCIKSMGEEEISKILKDNHIDFIREYSFNDLVGLKGGKLRFDFAIFKETKLIKLIEFQGRQHYEPQNTNWNDLTEHDELKRQYCKEHNIALLEIPYNKLHHLDINYLLNN